MEPSDALILAELFHLKPMSYLIRIGLSVTAFAAAMNIESALRRVIGLIFLILTGIGLLITGITHGTIADILLGLAASGAAAYSWWFTRH